MDTKIIDKKFLKPLMLRREDCSHKGDYGHALLMCGCRNMPGAAVLATGAALKSGCGLVTLHSVREAGLAAVSSFPSAMLSLEDEPVITAIPPSLARYSAIGTGPGLGKAEKTSEALKMALDGAKKPGIPMVLDADALNLISEDSSLAEIIPEGSVLTPHLGELRRLFPGVEDAMLDSSIMAFCQARKCVLVKKGWHTRIFTPEGECLENTTGNPGMAKGGSGDVLTGLVTGLLARGYKAREAAALGVWIHGFAGDCLTKEFTAEAYSSRDLIDRLYKGFKELI